MIVWEWYWHVIRPRPPLPPPEAYYLNRGGGVGVRVVHGAGTPTSGTLKSCTETEPNFQFRTNSPNRTRSEPISISHVRIFGGSIPFP